MRMNTSIPMMGQPVNVLGAMSAGMDMATRANANQETNALRNVFATQAPGIMAGDQGALTALMQTGPAGADAALGIQAQQQNMAIQRERLAMARQAAAQQAAAVAEQMSEAERAQAATVIGRGLATAIPALRAGDLNTVNQVLRTAGLDPVGSIDEAAMVISGYEEALRVFEGGQAIMGRTAPDEPAAVQALRIRAAEAGLQPGTPEYQQFMLQGGREGEGFEVITGPDGTSTIRYGSGVGRGAQGAGEDPLNPMPTMLEDIGRARELIEGNPTLTTGAGSILSGVPGSNARDVQALLDTVRANVGFAALQRMRDQSPTGGALGQVTERELALLQATLGNLEQSQSAEQILQNLNRLERQINEIVHGPQAAQPEAEPEARVPERPADMPQVVFDALPASPQTRARAIELWNNMTPEERQQAVAQ